MSTGGLVASYHWQIVQWLLGDQKRMDILFVAADYCLQKEIPDWCLAAGFVRNLVWDELHHFKTPTALNDVDLIYFDAVNISKKTELKYEAELNQRLSIHWSVKNQARMNRRNDDMPYQNTSDAMTYWPEQETAVGVCFVDGQIKVIAPFGLQSLFERKISLNLKRPKTDAFYQRIAEKGWLERWPDLTVIGG